MQCKTVSISALNSKLLTAQYYVVQSLGFNCFIVFVILVANIRNYHIFSEITDILYQNKVGYLFVEEFNDFLDKTLNLKLTKKMCRYVFLSDQPQHNNFKILKSYSQSKLNRGIILCPIVLHVKLVLKGCLEVYLHPSIGFGIAVVGGLIC